MKHALVRTFLFCDLLASSADGDKLAAVASEDGIYTWQATPTPQLSITAANGNLAFCWTVPSTNMILQEASGLSSGSWTTITNAPVLNLTNLQDQISLLPANTSAFFRLVAH